ncbi:hypothetical protein ACFE04_026978 [Oxalis oulophora]
MSTLVNSVISRENVEILYHLKRLNKPAVKSFKIPNGDIIDCVKITDQPAFDHPLLKNHTIQLSPTFYPKMGHLSNQSKQSIQNPFTQLWQLSGTCPKGTIPITRTKKSDILRASSIEAFGKKDQSTYATGNTVEGSGKHYGSQSELNVWNPRVENPNEFSLSQTWIVGGDGVEIIEAGWHVYPRVNGDYLTRLFIYWTADGYKQTGCYNLKCPGFVQTNEKITLGGYITPVSSIEGERLSFRLTIWKEPNTHNWWLQLGEEVVGYWPSSLFQTYLTHGADVVSWGGEITNDKNGGMHTTTQMGSGYFGTEGIEKASFTSNILVVDASNEFIQPPTLEIILTHPTCYNIATDPNESLGTHIFFGGPGRNSDCI